MIKHTDGQRATLASKSDLNLHQVPKASIGFNFGFDPHHPNDNLFYSPPSILIRKIFEPINWKQRPVIQQTYITNFIPALPDILLNDDFPQPDQAIDQTNPSQSTTMNGRSNPDTQILLPSELPSADFRSPRPSHQPAPVSKTASVSPCALPDTKKTEFTIKKRG